MCGKGNILAYRVAQKITPFSIIDARSCSYYFNKDIRKTVLFYAYS